MESAFSFYLFRLIVCDRHEPTRGATMLNVSKLHPVGKPVQFTGLHLDNIFLLNGFHLTKNGVAISDLDSLHFAIYRTLCGLNRPLSGKEFRALRKFVGFTLRDIQHYLNNEHRVLDLCLEQKTNIPAALDIAIRFIAITKLEGVNARVETQDLMNRRDSYDPAPKQKFLFQWNDQGWHRVHKTTT